MDRKNKIMKAYKITDNGKCLNQLYEVGQTYQIEGDLIMCQNGFHFCKNPDDLFIYYLYRKSITKIFEIEILGKYIDGINKSVTDKLKVIREIPLSEYNDLFKKYSFNEDGSELHFKDSDGFEEWRKYDNNGKLIHNKHLSGFESWSKYDNNDKLVHYKDSKNYEYWKEYDNQNNIIHYKDSTGYEYWRVYDDKGKIIKSFFKDSKIKKVINTDDLREEYGKLTNSKSIHFNCKDGDEAFTDEYVLWLENIIIYSKS